MLSLESFNPLNSIENDLVGPAAASKSINGKDHADRKIRSSLFANYIRGNLTSAGIRITAPATLHISDTILDGDLDLSSSLIQANLIFLSSHFSNINLSESTTSRLSFSNCEIGEFTGRYLRNESGVSFRETNAKSINLYHSKIDKALEIKQSKLSGGILADGAVIGSDFDLRESTSEGKISFINSKIGGDLYCGKVTVKEDVNAARADIKGGAFFNAGFNAKSLNLSMIRIAHALVLNSSSIVGTVNCNRSQIGGRVAARDKFSCADFYLTDAHAGGVDFSGSTVKGILSCSNAKIASDIVAKNGFSTKNCEIMSASVLGDISLSEATIEEELILTRSNVGGAIILSEKLSCRSLKMYNTKVQSSVSLRGITVEDSASLNSIEIKGDLFISQNTKIQNNISFLGAHISGDLYIMQSQIGGAAHGGRIRVEGNVDFSNSHFGRLVLSGAIISNYLLATNTKIEGREDLSALFDIRGASIGNDCDLNNGFECHGYARINNAKINGDLILTGSKSHKVSIKHFQAHSANINGAIKMHECVSIGTLDLRDAYAKTVVDSMACWPTKGRLLIDRFTYDSFGGDAPLDWKSRMIWLLRQRKRDYRSSQFKSQPFEQLATVLSKSGHQDAAKNILIQKQEHIRSAGNFKTNKTACIWHVIIGFFADYGYNPFKPVWILLAFIFLGTLLFQEAHDEGYMYPTKVRTVFGTKGEAMLLDKDLPEPYPKFNSLIFSVDVFLPFVDFHQEEYWIPKHLDRSGNRDFFFVVFMWIGVFFSWATTTLVVAGLTGLIKKDRD